MKKQRSSKKPRTKSRSSKKSRTKSRSRKKSKQNDLDQLGGSGKGVVFKGSPLLAKEYIDKDGNRAIDARGWWASEKFDGYRAIWNGKSFVSRNGKPYHVPKWFSDLMPRGIALDGEFWMGRGGFQNCGIFRKKNPDSKEWRDAKVTYTVYDIPSSRKSFEERMEDLRTVVNDMCDKHRQTNSGSCPLIFTNQFKIKNIGELDRMFNRIVRDGGEGVMLRKPGSHYEHKRSSTLLKYKQFGDTECKIVGYKAGTGKYKDMLGSFECELLKGTKKRFHVSGMDDCMRKNYKKTHPIGTVITITFNEKTKDGIPRFPRYLRKRSDHGL